MKQRPSIREVAKRAGVSHTTASLALRHHSRITDATRRRVEQAAAQLGYRPHALVANLMAQLRTLKTTPSHATIGFITAWQGRDDWRQSPNQRRFFDGVQKRAGELGYRVEVFWLREPNMTARRMSEILRARGIQGIILQSLPKAHGHLSLDWQHFAAVAKGLTIERPKLHRVISSHFEDMRLVMRHLKRLGYRRPGLVLYADFDARVDHAWLAAYLLHQHDLPAKDRVPALILQNNEGIEQFSKWLKKHGPEAILFTGVPMSAWIAKLGLAVPKDMGLVELDWSAEYGSLSGIDADSETIGAAAVDLLVGQLHANEFGVPQREKIVAVNGRWVEGTSLRHHSQISNRRLSLRNDASRPSARNPTQKTKPTGKTDTKPNKHQ